MFSDELHIFFQYLGRKILSEVDLKNPLESVFYGHVTDTINKYWVEYDKILSHYVDKAAIIGNVHYEILLNASKDRAEHFQATKAKNNNRQFLDNELAASDNNELFAPNPKVSSRLKRKKFEASEKTRARVDKDINNILGEAYREGWGPRYVGDKIRQRFTDLSTYEARRIAQTEINTTRNYVQYQRMQDDEMEYKIWHAAHDSRTRKSHLKVDEEIVPINERFSNGLMYPGDKDGDPSEWVNCRCSHAAYIMPLGYEAPDFFPFTESDLVKVGSSLSKDYVSEIQERIRLIDGAMVREQKESNIEKPTIEGQYDLTYEDLKTPEEVAEYFGYEYSFEKAPEVPKEYLLMELTDGRRIRFKPNPNKGKFHKFYDRENDCSIYFHQSLTNPSKAKETKGKIFIDNTNQGKGIHNLKDVLKMYDDAPKILKQSNTSITFTNRKSKRTYGYNRLEHDDKYVNNIVDKKAYDKYITRGKGSGWIDMYILSYEDDLERGHTMQRTLYHEMAHGLDRRLSTGWNNKERFSDNPTEEGYAARVQKQTNWDKSFRKKTVTPEELADGLSSEYGKRHWDKTYSYSEDFADAVSMVSFKNIPDKSAARELPPDWTWENKKEPYTYEEWVKRYPNKTKFLERLLRI